MKRFRSRKCKSSRPGFRGKRSKPKIRQYTPAESVSFSPIESNTNDVIQEMQEAVGSNTIQC